MKPLLKLLGAIGAVAVVVVLAAVLFSRTQTQEDRADCSDCRPSPFLAQATILDTEDVDFMVLKFREDYLEESRASSFRVQAAYQMRTDTPVEDAVVINETLSVTPGGRYVIPMPKLRVQGAFTMSVVPVDEDGQAVEQGAGEGRPEALHLSTFLFDEEDLAPVPNTPHSLFDAIDQELAAERAARKVSAEKPVPQKQTIGMKAVAPNSTCIDRNGQQIPCADTPEVSDTSSAFFFFVSSEQEALLRPQEHAEFFSFMNADDATRQLELFLQSKRQQDSLRFWDVAAHQTHLPIDFGDGLVSFPVENPGEAAPSVLEYLNEALAIS